MSESSSQDTDCETKSGSSPAPDPNGVDGDIPRAVLETASRLYSFISDEQAYECGGDVLDAASDMLDQVRTAAEQWADRCGHEGLCREAFAADAYQELLERVITSVALDSRLASRREQ